MVDPMLLAAWPALAAEIRDVVKGPERWQGMRRRSRPLIGMLLSSSLNLGATRPFGVWYERSMNHVCTTPPRYAWFRFVVCRVVSLCSLNGLLTSVKPGAGFAGGRRGPWRFPEPPRVTRELSGPQHCIDRDYVLDSRGQGFVGRHPPRAVATGRSCPSLRSLKTALWGQYANPGGRPAADRAAKGENRP